MPDSATHIIHRKLLEVTVPHREGLQPETEPVYRAIEGLAEAIAALEEQIFSRLFPDDRPVVLDYLEVDLGELPPLVDEAHFLEQYGEKLEARIIEWIEEQEHIPGAEQARDGKGSGTRREGYSGDDAVLYYLRYGYLPWWAEAASAEGTVPPPSADDLRQLLDAQPQRVIRWFAGLGRHRAVVARRIVLHYGLESLRHITRLAAPQCYALAEYATATLQRWHVQAEVPKVDDVTITEQALLLLWEEGMQPERDATVHQQEAYASQLRVMLQRQLPPTVWAWWQGQCQDDAGQGHALAALILQALPDRSELSSFTAIKPLSSPDHSGEGTENGNTRKTTPIIPEKAEGGSTAGELPEVVPVSVPATPADMVIDSPEDVLAALHALDGQGDAAADGRDPGLPIIAGPEPSLVQNKDKLLKPFDASAVTLKETGALPQEAEESLAMGESCAIGTAGLALLHPFLGQLLTTLGCRDAQGWRSQETHERAAWLLHYLATGETACHEHYLLFSKLLSGLAALHPLPPEFTPTAQEVEECDALLSAVISHWPMLGHTSPDGFRQTFLKRNGMLERRDSSYLLHVEAGPFDVLLDGLPWGYQRVKLSWMRHLVEVVWH